MRIALVEDDADHAALISRPLEAAGHICKVFATGSRFLQVLSIDTFDAVILDWSMPDMTGLNILEEIRHRNDKLPVLFVTCRGEEEDVVEAFRHGADDFLVKPARSSELLARLDALTRRTARNTSAGLISAGPYEFDLSTRQARVNGKAVELNSLDFRLATVFFTKPGILLSRAYLLETVWGLNTPVKPRTLDIHVSQMRIALQMPENGWRVNGIYAHGYRLEPLQSNAVVDSACSRSSTVSANHESASLAAA